jgi:hypothetical protein
LAGIAEVDRCISSLRELLKQLQAEDKARVEGELRIACQDTGKTLRPLPTGFAIGPFAVAIDNQRFVADLMYAKTSVVKGLPLNGAAIVQQVDKRIEELFGEIPQAEDLAAQLGQAIKVAAVRQDGRLPEGSIRADLPRVYNEMILIRQGCHPSPSAKAGQAYSLARFVVELVSLIRSELNERSQTFRLETAVLENTRNARKAIFVPNDPMIGYGEGTYYQALILMNWR